MMKSVLQIVKRFIRDILDPGRIRRRRLFRSQGIKGLGIDGLKMLYENEKLYAYQPLVLPDTVRDSIQWHAIERACEARWLAIEKHLPTEGAAIDIGSQHGFFVFHMAQRGLNAIGIERQASSCHVSTMLKLINDVPNATFFNQDINDVTVKNIPHVNVASCLSVFHHWVRERDLSYARSIMQEIANKCGLLFFETGQSNEKNVTWSDALRFMGDDPKKWIHEFLIELGFTKVECLGEFQVEHISDVPRYLFMASK